MSYRKLLLLYSLILLFLVTKTMHGDDHGGPGAAETSSHSSGHFLDDSSKLTTNEKEILAKVFDTTPDFIEDHHGQELGKVLDQAILNNQEDGVAKEIAKLFGPLNDPQISKLKKIVMEAKYDDKHKHDVRFGSLMDRLYLAATLIEESNTKEWDDHYSKFKEAFLSQWKKQKDKNHKFYDVLRDALSPDAAKSEPAKKALRENYDQGVMLGFIDAQRKTGNHKLANDLTNALSFDSLEGKPFIDAIGPDKTRHRILIGTDAEKSIGDFSDAQKGLRGFSLAKTPFAGDDAKLFPAGSPKITPRRSGTGIAPGVEAKVDAPKSTPAPAKPKHEDDVVSTFADNCAGCHSDETSKAYKKVPMTEDGELKERSSPLLKKILACVDGACQEGKLKLMPPGSPLDDAQKDQLREWAKSQGVE